MAQKPSPCQKSECCSSGLFQLSDRGNAVWKLLTQHTWKRHGEMTQDTNTPSASRSQRPQDVNFHTAISYVEVFHMHPVQRGDFTGLTELLMHSLFVPDEI